MIEMLHGEGTVKKEFPGKYILFKRYDIDISKEPMLIYPTLHYQNGGLQFRQTGATSVPGLFVAGEVGGGIHGANRLMGNSLLDIIVFGRIAGTSAAEFLADGFKDGPLSLDHVVAYNREVEGAGVADGRVSPALIPDYTDPQVRERQLTANYVGNVR
jgi:succinate dehydrogenase/fumarate reductase flavoprotein subunit